MIAGGPRNTDLLFSLNWRRWTLKITPFQNHPQKFGAGESSINLFTWDLRDLLLKDVRGTAGRLFEACALMRAFQWVHGQAHIPSAHIRGFTSVCTAEREWTRATTMPSLSALLLSYADYYHAPNTTTLS